MLLKVIVLFLLFMIVMAMVQKALRPGGRNTLSGPKGLDGLRCPSCKRVNFSNTPAPCSRPDCRYR